MTLGHTGIISSIKLRNMRIFIGALVVFFVSGEDRTTIEGFLNQQVRLPCNCSERNMKEEFRWQKERTGDVPEVVVVYKGYNLYDKKERVILSSLERNGSCDLCLTEVTAEDQGTFICAFSRQGYTKIRVDLKVYATYKICKKDPKVFHCDVQGHYEDAEIRWRLDGDFLTNSAMDNLTHHSWNASTGLHRFHSEFITHRDLTATPSCHVEAKYNFTNITETCGPKMGSFTGPQEIPQNSRRVFVIISVTLVLGALIFLYHRITSTRRRQGQLYKTTENECDSVSTPPG